MGWRGGLAPGNPSGNVLEALAVPSRKGLPSRLGSRQATPRDLMAAWLSGLSAGPGGLSLRLLPLCLLLLLSSGEVAVPHPLPLPFCPPPIGSLLPQTTRIGGRGRASWASVTHPLHPIVTSSLLPPPRILPGRFQGCQLLPSLASYLRCDLSCSLLGTPDSPPSPPATSSCYQVDHLG